MLPRRILSILVSPMCVSSSPANPKTPGHTVPNSSTCVHFNQSELTLQQKEGTVRISFLSPSQTALGQYNRAVADHYRFMSWFLKSKSTNVKMNLFPAFQCNTTFPTSHSNIILPFQPAPTRADHSKITALVTFFAICQFSWTKFLYETTQLRWGALLIVHGKKNKQQC